MESCFTAKQLKKEEEEKRKRKEGRKERNHEKSLSLPVYYGIQGHQSPMK